jgi:RNA polymerase sigma-70 factor (ECF subfamily)
MRAMASSSDVNGREPDRCSMADLGDVRDADLFRRIASGDEEAFRALFRRYAPTALALARRIVRQQNLAEEVMQEVFLSLWREGDRFDARRGTARAWVMGMVHKRAVDAVRREESQRRRADEASVPEAVDDPADEVAEDLDRPHERRAVRAALDTLPPDQRQVIELMYFDGLSQTRIAERLSLPLGTVKSRARLAMRRLRGVLLGEDR